MYTHISQIHTHTHSQMTLNRTPTSFISMYMHSALCFTVTGSCPVLFLYRYDRLDDWKKFCFVFFSSLVVSPLTLQHTWIVFKMSMLSVLFS